VLEITNNPIDKTYIKRINRILGERALSLYDKKKISVWNFCLDKREIYLPEEIKMIIIDYVIGIV
jgi:hypothetical protein